MTLPSSPAGALHPPSDPVLDRFLVVVVVFLSALLTTVAFTQPFTFIYLGLVQFRGLLEIAAVPALAALAFVVVVFWVRGRRLGRQWALGPALGSAVFVLLAAIVRSSLWIDFACGVPVPTQIFLDGAWVPCTLLPLGSTIAAFYLLDRASPRGTVMAALVAVVVAFVVATVLVLPAFVIAGCGIN